MLKERYFTRPPGPSKINQVTCLEFLLGPSCICLHNQIKPD